MKTRKPDLAQQGYLSQATKKRSMIGKTFQFLARFTNVTSVANEHAVQGHIFRF
jgi:hypothetical protein